MNMEVCIDSVISAVEAEEGGELLHFLLVTAAPTNVRSPGSQFRSSETFCISAFISPNRIS